MRYICWATYCEGASDRAYFNQLIPRILENILLSRQRQECQFPPSPTVEFGPYSRSFTDVARAVCADENLFHILFAHRDTGGRALADAEGDWQEAFLRALEDECGFPHERVIPIFPSREMESWLLADPVALQRIAARDDHELYRYLPRNGLDAEKVHKPKEVLSAYVKRCWPTSHSHYSSVCTRIGQEQDLALLRTAESFQDFERRLTNFLLADQIIE